MEVVIQQMGNLVTIQMVQPYPFPTVIAAGQGTIAGDTLQISYRHANGSMGAGQLQVSADGEEIVGTVVNQFTGQLWPVRLFR